MRCRYPVYDAIARSLWVTRGARHVASNVSEKQAGGSGQAEAKLPSFGRQLFLGDFRLDLIHPQPRSDSGGG